MSYFTEPACLPAEGRQAGSVYFYYISIVFPSLVLRTWYMVQTKIYFGFFCESNTNSM